VVAGYFSVVALDVAVDSRALWGECTGDAALWLDMLHGTGADRYQIDGWLGKDGKC
jgi:hypothetical protein